MAVSKKKRTLDLNKIPVHIAIIMDGNGRWAEKRRLSRSVGHREGAKAVREIVEEAYDIGVKYLTVFAFSSENWSRPKEEVEELMRLYLEYLKNAENETSDKDVRVRIIGSREGLSDEIIQQIQKVEQKTVDKERMNLIIALNYGGRQDIIQAVKKMVDDIEKGVIEKRMITEDELQKRLLTEEIPEPDLLIRTSGEMRLSNFLIWQCAYTEFYYSPILWPDFKKKHFHDAILDYQNRSRRFGGVK